jgi:pimeloyl-ACP methyl ester carboxylesterase
MDPARCSVARVKRSSFQAAVVGGELNGWVAGAGQRVLLLHGGPGISFEYLDGLAAEIGGGYELAAYQQRGLAPSTLSGPFDLETAIADAIAVLDALAWDRAWVVGHSWGAHLLLHLLVGASARLCGGLAIEPLGAVGDGGMADFEAEVLARTPERDRRRSQELDDRAMRGEGSPEEAIESMRLVWPAYFASGDRVMTFPSMRASVDAYAGLLEATTVAIPALERQLASVEAPFGCIAGAHSPMPYRQAAAPTAQSIPAGWLEVIGDGGHFPWFERPGCVRAGLQRLTTTARA